MFSTITTEPSTNIPIATAIPPSDIKLADTPSHAITTSAMAIEIGIEMSTRKVALRFIKNSASTTTIKINASAKASTTVCTALLIKSD